MNNILTSISFAIGSMRQNIGRATLTVFGVVIAIAMVIMVFAAGAALKQLVLGELSSFGDNWIDIEVKIPSAGRHSQENARGMVGGVTITTLTADDAEAIAELPNVVDIYAGLTTQAVVAYKTEKFRPSIFAVTDGYERIDKTGIARGRFFTSEEDRAAAHVVVLGHEIAQDLFGNEDPLGKSVTLNKKTYHVIGVMNERGVTGFFNVDKVVFVPLRTAQKKLMGIDHVLWVIAQVADNDQAETTAEEIRWLLRERHEIGDPDKDDFGVTTMAESMAIIDTVFTGVTWLLIALVAISLVVGGVGIMNVMYVSVAERTFEIGLRKAVGARRQDILYQFLIEAVTLTVVGGLVGVALGVVGSLLVAIAARSFDFAWEFSIPPLAVMIAVVFSTGVGLVFGLYPARRASNLDPIVAIRQE